MYRYLFKQQHSRTACVLSSYMQGTCSNRTLSSGHRIIKHFGSVRNHHPNTSNRTLTGHQEVRNLSSARNPHSTSSRLHSGVTFCQWRYMRRLASSRKAILPSPCATRSLRWSGSVAHETATSSLRWSSSGVTEGVAVSSTIPHHPDRTGDVRVADVLEKYHTLLMVEQESHTNTDTESLHLHPPEEKVVEFTTALRSAVYANLGWLPWLHNDNHVISFMQILMNGKIEELLKKPLYGQEKFGGVLQRIEEMADRLPDQDCPSILLSLLYSGVDRTEPLVHKLLGRCHKAIPVLGVSQLRDLTHVLQTLGGRDFALTQRILERLKEILSNDVREVDFEVRDLCVSHPVLAVFMSQNLVEHTAQAVLQKLKQTGPENLDIFTIGCSFRYARKMKFRVNGGTLGAIKCLGKKALDGLEDCSHLQSYHIAEICHNAKNLGCFSGDIVDRVQERSLQLLRAGGLHVRDVTNLLFAFSRNADPQLKQEATQLLIEHLEDADVLTLSNIADNILDLDLHDPELIDLFQSKVMQNIDNISLYITRLVKILRLLRERRHCNRRFNQKLAAVLLKTLSQHQGYDPTLVVVVGQFVLPNVRTVIPALLMEALLYAVPRCNLSLILMVLSSLDKIGSPRSRTLHNQMLELQSCMQQNIGKQIHSATHASQLANLIKGLHIKSRTKDLALLEQIMDHYPTLTPSMTRADFLRTLFTFKRLNHPYYHPRVFEDLIAFTRDNYSQLNCTAVVDLVTVLSRAGYRPKDFVEFANFTTQVLEEVLETGDHTSHVSLAHGLSLMSVFPDHLLGHIFTFQYLESLDRAMEETDEGRVSVRKMMMELNRAVILECPHLDVPWFHQHYCQTMVESGSKDFYKNTAMVEEVDGALQEVMSGQDCVARRVYSPYFHPIDYEVVLDTSGQPIPAAAVKLLRPEELGYQRVALMLLGNQQLCTNSAQRRGHYMQDRRHLEILGYRVEEISRLDWHSMALNQWSSKVDFVRSKLLQDNGNNNNQLMGSAASSTSTQQS